MSRLGRQMEEVIATLSRLGVPFALIGGLALASHKVIRATQDIDLLTDASRADDIPTATRSIWRRFGGISVFSSASNYWRRC